MSGPFGSSQFMYATGAEEGQSLRFEDGDSAYLSFTPTSSGNRKTFTISVWCKRGNLGLYTTIFDAYDGSSTNQGMIRFQNTDEIAFRDGGSSSSGLYITNAKFRDPSAWYHIVAEVDTTLATASDRVKLYVNGVSQTFGTATNTQQNNDGQFNYSSAEIRIGANNGTSNELDGYLANVAFIDGTALTPSSFGEYDGTLWKPKSDTDIQALTFGTNGFYLPFKQTTEAEGFSTVTYTGNGGTQSIEGVGFEPDFVWVKSRSNSYDHALSDSVRGAGVGYLSSNLTVSESTYGDRYGDFSSFDPDGFTVAKGTDSTNPDVAFNLSGGSYVAWCWDAGTGSAASNTDGTITSSVKANTAKGFSIATYTGTGASGGATVGHGLSSAPEFIITKPRSTTGGWLSGATAIGWTKYIALNSTSAEVTDADAWNNTAPTNSVFSVDSAGGSGYSNGTGVTYVAYSFHSVSGYSSIGSYSGNGSTTGPVVTTGFKPAFVMIKRTDGATDWVIVDSTRDPSNPIEDALNPNQSYAENTGYDIDFDSNGFTIKTTTSYMNASGGTYIYMAFKDTRDATFFGDTSGNGNNWTPNALNNTDVVLDAPVSGGNFATLNPLDKDGHTNSEGNLKVAGNVVYGHQGGTFAVTSGKWYFEAILTVQQNDTAIALKNQDADTDAHYTGQTTDSVGYLSDGRFFYNGSSTSYSSYSTGDVAQIAFDADTGEIWIGKNNTWQNSGDPAAGTGEVQTVTWNEFIPAARTVSTGEIVFNFGQDSSFAGNETPQGNTDDNGVGDFYYAPPSGFLALATSNLPLPAITAPDEYFNTVLWTGNASDRDITGVGFSPDWVWVKNRSNAYHHGLFDSVRGANKVLKSSDTSAEATFTEQLTSFNADGFSVGDNSDSGNYVNISGHTYVAWNWLAGNGTVSNTDGSITSTVSANQTAGFSVLTYTGNGTIGASIGHGLGVTPDLLITKNRSSGSSHWAVYLDEFGGTKRLLLSSTSAMSSDIAYWNNTDATSSVFSVYNNIANNASGDNYVAYAFNSVESYSKIGSYTGNGSADGTFVHCGFRPAFVIVKRTDSTGNWLMYDNKRPEYNSPYYLLPNTSFGGDGSDNPIDFLSNGFKLKTAGGGINVSSGTYIFIAFAEAPFKSANAR